MNVRITLRQECASGRGGRGGGGGGTVGAVDLGGSSLEVSFVPDEPFHSSLESQGLPASCSSVRMFAPLSLAMQCVLTT